MTRHQFSRGSSTKVSLITLFTFLIFFSKAKAAYPMHHYAQFSFLVLVLGFMTPDLSRLRGGSIQVEAVDADDPDSPNR